MTIKINVADIGCTVITKHEVVGIVTSVDSGNDLYPIKVSTKYGDMWYDSDGKSILGIGEYDLVHIDRLLPAADTVAGGKKFDSGKPDLSLIPLSALIEEARGFELGKKKYGRDNYKKGMETTRILAAALRHIHQYLEGEDTDPESGASHLGHARCCMAMVLECTKLGTIVDDRFKKEDK